MTQINSLEDCGEENQTEKIYSGESVKISLRKFKEILKKY